MTLTIRCFEEADRASAVDLFVELNGFEHGISGDRKTDVETARACMTEAEDLVANRRKLHPGCTGRQRAGWADGVEAGTR